MNSREEALKEFSFFYKLRSTTLQVKPSIFLLSRSQMKTTDMFMWLQFMQLILVFAAREYYVCYEGNMKLLF